MVPRFFKTFLLCLFTAASCTTETAREPTSQTSPAISPGRAATGDESPTVTGRENEHELLYLDRKSLRILYVNTDSTESAGRLPSTDVVASSDGSLVAYVDSATTSTGEEDFVAQPELHVYDVVSGRDVTVGPGFSPIWHPNGNRIAYLEPQEARVCEGEICEGANSLVIAHTSTNKRTTILAAGDFVPLGWLGDEVIVSLQRAQPATVAVSETGITDQLPVDPSEFWGASPDGSWIVRSIAGKIEFISTESQNRQTVSLPGSVLGEGAWSPDSKRVVAVSLGTQGKGSTKLLDLDAGRGETSTIGQSKGASGPVLWADDGSAFVYVRAAGGRGLDLEAVFCEMRADAFEECRSLFSWPRGITLLALK